MHRRKSDGAYQFHFAKEFPIRDNRNLSRYELEDERRRGNFDLYAFNTWFSTPYEIGFYMEVLILTLLRIQFQKS